MQALRLMRHMAAECLRPRLMTWHCGARPVRKPLRATRGPNGTAEPEIDWPKPGLSLPPAPLCRRFRCNASLWHCGTHSRETMKGPAHAPRGMPHGHCTTSVYSTIRYSVHANASAGGGKTQARPRPRPPLPRPRAATGKPTCGSSAALNSTRRSSLFIFLMTVI